MKTAKEIANYVFHSLFSVTDLLSYKQHLALNFPENTQNIWSWYHEGDNLSILYNNQIIFCCYKECKLIEFHDRQNLSAVEREIIFALKDFLKNYLNLPIQAYYF